MCGWIFPINLQASYRKKMYSEMESGINYPPPHWSQDFAFITPWYRNFRKIRGKTFFLSVPKSFDFSYICFQGPQKTCLLKVSRLAAIFCEVSASEAGRKNFLWFRSATPTDNFFITPPPGPEISRLLPPGPETIPKIIGCTPWSYPTSSSNKFSSYYSNCFFKIEHHFKNNYS